jgi:hypothetical protein
LMDSRELSWRLNLIDSDITHYRPAWKQSTHNK